MKTTSPIAAEFYEKRTREYAQQRDRLARRSLQISNLRGLAFVVFAGAGGAVLLGWVGLFGVLLSGAGLVSFVALVVHHSKVIEQQDEQERWVRVNQDASKRLSGADWHALPHDGERLRDAQHLYADDLDIFGHASLFQRICVAQTFMGQERLAEMLSQPAERSQMTQRQALIRALAAQLELRQRFEVLALATRDPVRQGQTFGAPKDVEPLYQWVETSPNLANLAWLRWTRWGLPLVTMIGIFLSSIGLLPAAVALTPLCLHLYVLIRSRPSIRLLNQMLTATERTVAKIGPLFQLIESSESLEPLKESLQTSTDGASHALKSLQRIADWFELRHNGLIYPFVNIAVLWDIHCALAFESWRIKHGRYVRQWFAVVGELEALSSLAGLLHDEPDSCFAEVLQDHGFEAVALGHPLIHPNARVRNDVVQLSRGQGLLVTGSNMSGKSTYLRAMGVAAVLGLAGGPVCAKRLRIGALRVATSMRIRDDLASGVSHFYAELQKLKRVLEVAHGQIPVLFLLDEILHGTNSRERQIGARFILSELLRSGAFGAVSTHDLALCELTGDLSERLRLVHFRESVVNNEMTFDYRQYPGPITAGNALRLMNTLGIRVPVDAE